MFRRKDITRRIFVSICTDSWAFGVSLNVKHKKLAIHLLCFNMILSLKKRRKSNVSIRSCWEGNS